MQNASGPDSHSEGDSWTEGEITYVMGAGPSASFWRAWSEKAPQALLEDFQSQQLGEMRRIRRNYGAECGPNHPGYLDMKFEMNSALNTLAHHIQEHHDAEY